MPDDVQPIPAPKKRKAAQRRSYSTELSDLQAEHMDLKNRVAMAVRLMEKSLSVKESADDTLIEVAIDTLKGI